MVKEAIEERGFVGDILQARFVEIIEAVDEGLGAAEEGD